LAAESIDIMKAKGVKVSHGVFAENMVTEGIELPKIPIGTKIRLGEAAIVEVTQIGKECHSHCEIYRQAGDCIMPREGIFVKVIEGGPVKPGDKIEILGDPT
jgi:MOSC domain-containing protein YiiM